MTTRGFAPSRWRCSRLRRTWSSRPPTARPAIALAGSLRPDLVVVDISMPGMSGIDAAAEIVKALPQTRIVFVSGTETEQKLEEAAYGGRYAVVRKDAPDLSCGVPKTRVLSEQRLSGCMSRNFGTPQACTEFCTPRLSPSAPLLIAALLLRRILSAPSHLERGRERHRKGEHQAQPPARASVIRTAL